jgi:rubrerythrin
MLDAADARLLIVDDDDAATVPARVAERRDFKCSRCGYGVAVTPPPGRCPMCNRTAAWTHVPATRYELIA